MNNRSPFSDSPRPSTFYPLPPTESPLHLSQAPQSSSSSDLESPDRLSELPGDAIPPSPHRSIGNQPGVMPMSRSAPSQRGLLATQSLPSSPQRYDVRPLTAERSTSPSNSQQRVAFEGDRASAPTPSHSPRMRVHPHPLLRDTIPLTARVINSPATRMNHSSDPSRPSSVVLSAGVANSPKVPGHESPTASTPHSRTTSPLRRFGWSPFHHPQEDTFVPVDPFQFRMRLRHLSLHGPDIESHLPSSSPCEENLLCCVAPLCCGPKDPFLSFLRDARYFALDTLPRQIYLHLLLRLPSLYFSRIARVYEDAQLSKPDLERMIDTYCNSGQQQQRQRIIRSSPIPPGAHYHPHPNLPFPDEWTTATVSPALLRFKHSWEAFIDSLLREWKTLNLVSALLHSAIIGMFQNQQMSNDPVIRTAALLSLTSALMSLSYGCIYIVRFGTMRSMYKASRWAEEAARTTTFILWNVWVMLAMPAIWLAWSMIFFIVSILAFVWRYGSSTDPTSPQLLGPTAAIGPRIAISALFFLGLLYLAAIVKTLHTYGRYTDYGLFRTVGNRMSNDDIWRDERGSQRGRDGDYGYEPTQATRGRGRTRPRHEQDATEPGGLSAVTGLGLTGLDEFMNLRDLGEMPEEKQRHQSETSS